MPLQLAPEFPLEIFHTIVDILEDDETCSLVCWAWLHLVRHRRFAVLFLQQSDLNRLRKFPEALKSPLSTIVPVVEELHIVSKSSIDFNQDIKNLPPFPRLRLFRLGTTTSQEWEDKCDPIELPNDIFNPHSFETLTILGIIFDFESFSHMLRFICSFPCLEILDLEGDWPEEEAIPDKQYHPSHLLHTLSLRMHVSTVIEGWLLALDPVPQVQTLVVRSGELQPYKSLGRLLAAQGESLKHFVLRERGSITSESVESFREHVNLKLNTNLESLHLVGAWKAAEDPDRAQFYKEVITQGLSNPLRKILIQITGPPNEGSREPLSLLDQHIAQLAPPSLESVVLEMPNCICLAAEFHDLGRCGEKKIREWFKECNGRGTLYIEAPPKGSAADRALSQIIPRIYT